MHAATQQAPGTIDASARWSAWLTVLPPIEPEPMPSPRPKLLLIKGQTRDGRTFRPSDWAERLASAMACFRPGGGSGGGIGAFIGYSPYCVPRVEGELKCVLVSEALREIEPMAWDFVTNFARDNALQVVDVSEVGDPPTAAAQ
jgi:Protein of unknown function (DUF3579)